MKILELSAHRTVEFFQAFASCSSVNYWKYSLVVKSIWCYSFFVWMPFSHHFCYPVYLLFSVVCFDSLTEIWTSNDCMSLVSDKACHWLKMKYIIGRMNHYWASIRSLDFYSFRIFEYICSFFFILLATLFEKFSEENACLVIKEAEFGGVGRTEAKNKDGKRRSF